MDAIKVEISDICDNHFSLDAVWAVGHSVKH